MSSREELYKDMTWKSRMVVHEFLRSIDKLNISWDIEYWEMVRYWRNHEE